LKHFLDGLGSPHKDSVRHISTPDFFLCHVVDDSGLLTFVKVSNDPDVLINTRLQPGDESAPAGEPF
jgi:hypothetical protein